MNFYNKEENQHHLKICIAIESHLIHTHNLLPKREWYLIFDSEDHIVGIPRFEITEAQKKRKEKYRNPDILFWDNGLWIIEIDGLIHHIKSVNTEKRDNIYKNNNCNYIVLKTYEIKDDKSRITNRAIEDIIKELDYKINDIKRIKKH